MSSFDALPVELVSYLLAFCAPDDLAVLDVTCTSMCRQFTPEHWETSARRRFGNAWGGPGKRGKEKWKAGAALFHPEKSVCIPLARHGPDLSFAGSPKICASEGLLVMGSDGHHHYPNEMPGEPMQEPLLVRRATGDFGFVRFVDGSENLWQVALLGERGEEIIVSARDFSHVHAVRVEPPIDDVTNRSRTIDFHQLHARYNIQRQVDYIDLLACQSMVIVASRGHFFVFVPHERSVIEFVQAIPFGDDVFHKNTGLTWLSPDLGERTFACSTGPGRLRVWRADLDVESNSVRIHNRLAIHDPNITKEFVSIAVSERFVALSPENTKDIFVYDHNGTRLHSLSEGLNEDDFTGEDGEFIYPICLVSVGELLISSSMEGAALCVWDMKKGTLLSRMRDLFTRGRRDPLPEGLDITSMAPLYAEGAVCFCTAHECMYVWAFAGDMSRQKELKAIAKNENRIQQRMFDSDSEDGESDSDISEDESEDEMTSDY